MLELAIDPDKRTISATVLLRGEQEPITIGIDDYRFESGGEGAHFTAGHVRCSRAWMEAALQTALAGRSLPVPEKVAALVQGMLGS